MASSTICTLASIEPGTVLDMVIRFSVFDLKSVVERRVGGFAGIEDGIVQDFGISEFDRVIIGEAYVSSTEGTLLTAMYESSTTFWAFADGIHLYKVYFITFEKAEVHGKKTTYSFKFGVKEKLV